MVPRLRTPGVTPSPDALFREFFPRLVTAVRPLTRDRALAEDVAQETLMRLFANADGLDLDEPIWPWLKMVAVRLGLDQVRRDRREMLADADTMSVVGPGHGYHDVYSSEDSPSLMIALRRLTPRHRIAVALRYLADEDPVQTAASFGLSKPAFEQLLFRARRRLAFEYELVLAG
jgi:RNA polymerase sigma factor (sigma-70 family)